MRKVALALVITVVVATMVVVGYYFYGFFLFLNSMDECGFDDGPFVAEIVDTSFSSRPDEILKLRNGELFIYNSEDSLPPVILFFENAKAPMGFKMDISGSGYELWKVEGVSVTSDNNLIKLDFTAHWIFGVENGSMRINKETGENSFCLSW